MNIDPHTIVDIFVALFSALSAWNNLKIGGDIKSLKLWIIRNFDAKANADFRD